MLSSDMVDKCIADSSTLVAFWNSGGEAFCRGLCHVYIPESHTDHIEE